MANARPRGSAFVTETLTAPVLVIVISPGQGIGLITDAIAGDSPDVTRASRTCLWTVLSGKKLRRYAALSGTSSWFSHGLPDAFG